MEEIAERNGKGVWMREIEKVLRRFEASLEWLMRRNRMLEMEMASIRLNEEMEDV